MGKSFKRLLAERRKQHKQLPAKQEILEQIVVEEKMELPKPVVTIPEVVEVAKEEEEVEDKVSSEELAKSVLLSQNKKVATKKK